MDGTRNTSGYDYYNDEYYTTNDSYDYGLMAPIKQPDYLIVIYSLAYSIIFLTALIGNGLLVILTLKRRFVSKINYFLVNLALSGLLVAVVCIPITLLSNLYNGWPFGAFLCRATPYLQGVSVCASVNTLAAIAIDRYLAICHSIRWRTTTKTARVTVVTIWVFSCLLMLPWAIFYEEYEHKTPHQVIRMCHQIWPDFESQRGYFMGAIFIGCYVLPLSVVFLCYIFIGLRVWNRHAPGVAKDNQLIRRSKIKVVKMLAVMVLLFTFSWMPLHVIFIKLYYSPPTDSETMHFIWNVAVPISQWLELSNSGINPIIYCFFSKNFRRGFKNMLACFAARSKRQRSRGYSSVTKYMTIEYTNGNVTISFRKEGREDSSSTV
ncbi:neuropeptide SIFamide receptor-like [Patella vulgata]|uniref:neuropeptide SIFamide receptor-like n=1 Tax=Patella vulgata TaxID=6465 RepID=UPI00217FB84A|nr:neuropeptide SIFamide receptor-like [Patella vulgata]